MKTSPSFAIYYAGDAYSTANKIMGRQSAGKAFMRGIARTWPKSELHGFGQGTEAATAMYRQLAGDGFVGQLKWIEVPNWAALGEVGTLYYPSPIAKDFAFSKAKGFQAQKEIHLATLVWAADSLAQQTVGGPDSPQMILALVGRFNEQLPQDLFTQWKALPAGNLKTTLASKLLSHKGHGLHADQLKELGDALKGKVEREDDLIAFLSQPDWRNAKSLRSFTQFLGVADVLNANPYFTPLILSAAAQTKDPLAAYDLLNSASEFNKDPELWIKKIQAAQALGLDNYANAAREELSQWLSQEEIEKLLGAEY
jgi:hypothetical protein